MWDKGNVTMNGWRCLCDSARFIYLLIYNIYFVHNIYIFTRFTIQPNIKDGAFFKN